MDLCLPALKYLRQCCDIIAMMRDMPNCPVFNGADRLVGLDIQYIFRSFLLSSNIILLLLLVYLRVLLSTYSLVRWSEFFFKGFCNN